jgi:hypothetical protein
VGETIVDNWRAGMDDLQSRHQGWWRSINKNFGHPWGNVELTKFSLWPIIFLVLSGYSWASQPDLMEAF